MTCSNETNHLGFPPSNHLPDSNVEFNVSIDFMSSYQSINYIDKKNSVINKNQKNNVSRCNR